MEEEVKDFGFWSLDFGFENLDLRLVSCDWQWRLQRLQGECMAFLIVEVLDLQPENILVKALHHSNEVPVSVRGAKNDDILAGQSIQGELGFDEILDWQVVSEFEDGGSGIWQAPDGIHLLGRVHSILDYGDGRIVIDVYIQNGPELFTVNLNATEEEAPDANDGLEIIVKKMFLFPVS